MVISNSILLFLNISIFSVGLYFVFRFIQSLAHKQDELIKKVDHIQCGLNEVKTNVDRTSTVLWSLQDDLNKITGVMEEVEKEMGEYDEGDED
jgi:septal ring factor EnvC (AmiA/AmiB activator)